MINDFKKFISRGNVLDLAVAVILGTAFGKIVSSLVNDIVMPIIGTILGGIDFTSLNIKVNDAYILYGNFIQNIINFVVIAAAIFMIIKFIEKFKKEEVVEEVVEKPSDIKLLEEIRDLLKKK